MTPSHRSNWRTSPASARILAELAKGPRYACELPAIAYCAYSSVAPLLAAMYRDKAIHIDGWGSPSGHLCRRWAIGDGTDAPPPAKAIPGQSRIGRPKGSAPAARRLLEALIGGNIGAADELASSAIVSASYARAVLNELHAERRVVVTRWRENPHGSPTPIYALRQSEAQRDAPRPKELGVTARRERVYQRLLRAVGRDHAEAICAAMFRGTKSTEIIMDGRAIYRRGAGLDLAAIDAIVSAKSEHQGATYA